ncbi:hypothetical protein DTL21_07355 [Bremerella cremea]|uniref:Uncharacterized protein n=1 Tax=Blastopirellula marina TaxID=124 RepID=A0A2S8FZX7_9BACT|nr:hypothetical protein C5Y83_07355 [Blastopirellula marina]RCS50139.1 hypothetical protein DTL21_07355 [Bremerella cremea]
MSGKDGGGARQTCCDGRIVTCLAGGVQHKQSPFLFECWLAVNQHGARSIIPEKGKLRSECLAKTIDSRWLCRFPS